MKKILFVTILFSALQLNAQLDQLNLNNTLVVGQLDKPEDRYSIEINLTELLTRNNIKAIPSLNIMKMGGNPDILVSDSVTSILNSKGIDTYLVVVVKGYDRKFKSTIRPEDLKTVLEAGSLYPIYRDGMTSISFEFMFFRGGKMIAGDIVKCGGAATRDEVIKKLRKGLEKRITKWK